MVYDGGLAERIEQALQRLDPPDLVDKEMFGGIGYLVLGNMACGVHKDNLIVRVGPDAYQEALQKPGAGLFDITGRPMTGWVMVDGEAVSEDDVLASWIGQGVAFALTLPPK
jgi:TfoX/Sxy family transcriptional regulator of competence genes